MTTLTDRLLFPNTRKVFLLEATAGEQLIAWVKTGGYTNVYEATASWPVVSMTWDGEALTGVASVALVDSTNDSYYFVAATMKVYVHLDDGA